MDFRRRTHLEVQGSFGDEGTFQECQKSWKFIIPLFHETEIWRPGVYFDAKYVSAHSRRTKTPSIANGKIFVFGKFFGFSVFSPIGPLCFFWVFHKNCFFLYFKWNWGGLGVSRVTAPTVRCYLQIFSRFGGTWHRKVHFSTFSGKLTFQSSRNGFQNPPYCPGSLQDIFIIYSSISHQHNFRKYFPEKIARIDNMKIWNFKKPRLLTSAQISELLFIPTTFACWCSFLPVPKWWCCNVGLYQFPALFHPEGWLLSLFVLPVIPARKV